MTRRYKAGKLVEPVSEYRYSNGDLIEPVSQIDAMYLRSAALEAGDYKAAVLFEDEADAFANRDLDDERTGR